MKDRLDEFLGMDGILEVTVLNRKGTKSHSVMKNTIVTAGKNWEAAYLGDSPPANMGWIAVGTGTTAADVADTALETELDRNTATRAVALNVISYSGLFTAGEATGAITEYGLLNASSGGTMFSRSVQSVKNVGASDSLQVVWHQTKG